MARFDKDPFPGTDYSRYLEWNPVQTPSGEVYYEVPGYPGYVFDPVASNATGRKVFRRNPKKEIEEIQSQQELRDKAIKQEQAARSPLNQLMPVGASALGTIAVNQLSPVKTDPIQTAVAEMLKSRSGDIASQTVNAVPATQQLPQVGALSSPTPIGTAVDGGTLMSDGSVMAADAPWFGSGGSLFNTQASLANPASLGALNIAGGALGAYGAYNASKMQNKRQGIMSGAASGAAAGASLAPATLGLSVPIGAIIGALAGAAAHETTKHRSQRRYGELGSMGGSSNFQDLVNRGAQESLSGADTWDLGDDKSQAPIDLMTRSYGVLKTFGPQWANVSDDKKQAVVRELVNNDLINSKQGDYLIDNPGQAQAIMQSVLNPGSQPKVTPQAQAAANSFAKVPPGFRRGA